VHVVLIPDERGHRDLLVSQKLQILESRFLNIGVKLQIFKSLGAFLQFIRVCKLIYPNFGVPKIIIPKLEWIRICISKLVGSKNDYAKVRWLHVQFF